MNINHYAPRHLRSYLHAALRPHTIKGAEEHCLYLLSPKQCGGKQWRFAVLYHDEYVIIGKGVSSRDVGRVQGVARYGVKAQEIRGDGVRVVKQAKQPKPSYADRLAERLAG